MVGKRFTALTMDLHTSGKRFLPRTVSLNSVPCLETATTLVGLPEFGLTAVYPHAERVATVSNEAPTNIFSVPRSNMVSITTTADFSTSVCNQPARRSQDLYRATVGSNPQPQHQEVSILQILETGSTFRICNRNNSLAG